jgi:hypothetical protein
MATLEAKVGGFAPMTAPSSDQEIIIRLEIANREERA